MCQTLTSLLILLVKLRRLLWTQGSSLGRVSRHTLCTGGGDVVGLTKRWRSGHGGLNYVDSGLVNSLAAPRSPKPVTILDITEYEVLSLLIHRMWSWTGCHSVPSSWFFFFDNQWNPGRDTSAHVYYHD